MPNFLYVFSISQIKGKNVPKPIKTWPQAGISKKVLDVLKKLNFEKPTPIQAQALPAIMSGRDLIAIAKTGKISRDFSVHCAADGNRPAFG